MFLENKYTQWYHKIINEANHQPRKRNDGNYYEAHHIIPRCMGGEETVLLTAKEHYICHLLLCKMTTGSDKHKMINALIKLTYAKSDGQKRYTARSYELVRKFIAQKNSEMFKGVPKSQETKNKMKGVNGKWIRTEEHRKAQSERQKGRVIHLDENARKKISEKKMGNKCGLGNKSVVGLIWVNNGEKRMMVKPNEIPSGYVKGKNYALAKKV